MKYDSEKETKTHIWIVCGFLVKFALEILKRCNSHDSSKLQKPEKPVYDEFTPKLRESTYGSDEYKAILKEIGPALKHHYENNSHHPEHFENGVNGMTLLDLIEMLADWKAATLRHDDGDIQKSLKINKERFGISDQLSEIFENTIKEMGW